MLKISQLAKHYRSGKKSYFWALNKVEFEIKDENMVAIIGESGSGKSTLMNLISTIDTPSNGFVEYNNKKVTFLKEKEKANHRKENVGFIFQSFNLIADISVLDNVAIVMEIAGHGKEERYKRAKELLSLVGLDDHINKKPGFLSGGQKQRVAIARALANDPELILADEPTGALDRTTSTEIMKLLSTIAASGKKVLIVTHDMKVASYCERIIKMADGNIIEDVKNDFEVLDTIDLPKPLEKKKGSLKFSGIFKLSSSAFKKRLKNNILISVGAAIAIASLFVINITTSSINYYFEDLYKYYSNENAASVMVMPLETSETGASIQDLEKKIDFSQYDEIKKYSKIPTYNIQFQKTFMLDEETMLNVKSLYPDDIRFFGERDLVSGSEPSSKKEVVISEDVVKKLNMNSDEIIGKSISLNMIDNTEQTTEVVDFKVSGVATNDGAKSVSKTIYFTDEYSKSFGKSPIEYFGNYIVEVKDGKIEDFIKKINDSNTQAMKDGYVVMSFRSLQDIAMIEIMLESTLSIFSVILGVSVFVAVIMIAVMSYVSVLERMREVGVLRAIGAQKKDVLKMFLMEATAIGFFAGVFASIIGIISGFALVSVANRLIDFSALGASLQLHISPIAVIIVILGSTILAVLSSIISIMRGLSIPPVEALKMK